MVISGVTLKKLLSVFVSYLPYLWNKDKNISYLKNLVATS